MRAISCVAFDYGGTISGREVTTRLGSKPVSPAGVELLTALSALGVPIILASNTLPHQDRRPALQDAGVEGLFAAVLQSHLLDVAKPDLRFFAHVAEAAACPRDRILYVGNNLRTDAIGAVRAGMRAALLRPLGLKAGEALPPGAVTISRLAEVPSLLDKPREWWGPCG